MRQRIGIGSWLLGLGLALGAGPPAALGFEHPGGVITAAQIERARLALAAGEEPWKSAWTDALARAQAGLGEAPSAVADYYVPAYYEDPAGHEAAKLQLRDDVNAAYSCALVRRIGFGLDAATRASHAAKARQILGAWASVNRDVSGPDGRLVMAYVGTAFVSAAELLADDPAWSTAARASFTSWVDTIVREAALLSAHDNNRGSWGVFAGLVGAHWRDHGAELLQHAARLQQLIDLQIDPSGNLPDELDRGEMGLWYTYFSLAPLTHAAELLRDVTGDDLFGWQPPSGGSLAQAVQAFYVAAEQAQGGGVFVPPMPGDWGGDLLFAIGSARDRPQWVAWSDPPFGSGNAAWKTPDLLTLPAPSRAAGLLAGAAALALLARRRSARAPSAAQGAPR